MQWQKGTTVDKTETMNATLEKEIKRKTRALHVRVVVWVEKGSAQEDVKNLKTITDVWDIPIISALRTGIGDSRPKALTINFVNMEKITVFISR